ncbi:BatD family protein [Candidatus Avelusimicrobium aviculae]|uniref:BatD family protein n=1 Tax=Candidatus Avelusimicrobium aviculae TaxID=3416206 RepID=UPI003D09975C
MRIRNFLLTLAFAAAALAAHAQVTMTASVDKTNLSLDDELTLTVQITGASGNVVMPQLPSLPAFNVYSREVSSMNINGQTSTVFRYVMLPRFPTQATIGAIRFTYNGQVYTTQPIQVNIYRRVPAGRSKGGAVQQASSSGTGGNYDSAVSSRTQNTIPQALASTDTLAEQNGDKSFFMTAAVNNTSPYVNQQVELIVRFYYSRPFAGQPPYTPPTVNNIFMEPLKQNTEGSQILQGKMFRYIENRYALSGVQAGKAVIGPAMVQFQPGSNDVFSAFDRLFGGLAAEPQQLVKSNPITLNIQATPTAGRPASFYGAVGTDFTLQAQADRTQVEAGESINLTVTVKGPGNLKPTSDLKIPQINGFRVYDVASDSVTLPLGRGTQSTKTFKTVLVPTASGSYTIPALAWSYFNPKTKRYVTLTTKPISVEVTPSTKADNAVSFTGGNTSGGFRQLGKDIRYIKTDPYPGEVGWLVSVGALTWLAWIFIFLPVICRLAIWLGKDSLKSKAPILTARNQLKKACVEEQVAAAVEEFLLKRFHINMGSNKLREVLEILKQKGVHPDTLKAFAALWQRLDAARFAPENLAAADTRALAAQALNLLKHLDSEGRL